MILRVISVFINLIVLIPALRKLKTEEVSYGDIFVEASAIYASAYMASVVKKFSNEADVAYPE